MPLRKKTAVRSFKRASPKDSYLRLVATREQTLSKLQTLEAKYGFGQAAEEAATVPEVPLSVAIDFTADPDMLQATFVVPRMLACEMVETFAIHARVRAAAA